ncbi:LTA synthase family protein [Paenibacillus sp. Leaf72]|uniref:LTA synthase family protein n=1 Tax=Paenibacillus sp. Leaf72 TaxID=1736234 RepID=UPI00070148B5|nr:LTA synthase family protein [Paenibacillus sp. Leaf72]KQN98988.1 sulfatase [Paenibacillus sp. Leaf72]
MQQQLFGENKQRSPFLLVYAALLIKLALFRYFIFDTITIRDVAMDGLGLLGVLLLFELIAPGKRKGALFLLVNAVLSLLLFASTVYFDYYGSVPTYNVLKSINQVGQVRASVQTLIQPVYFTYFLDVAIWLAVYAVRRFRTRKVYEYKRMGRVSVLLVVLIVSTSFLSRQVYMDQSIANELERAKNLGFIGFQASAAWQASTEAIETETGSLSETIAEINKLQASYPYAEAGANKDAKGKLAAKQPVQFGTAAGKNLIVLQMEAFQKFPIHLKVDGQEITPTLNQLADEGYYFPHVYQQIGQGNTSDAEFMSNTSIYPVGSEAMSKGYGDRAFPSLPKLLQEKGYDTATFHINNVTFWDRDKLYPALGFDAYYDKPYYTDDHFNDFGASDEELYRVGVQKLAEMKQPFYAQFVTASSHFPFKVPADRVTLTLPDSLAGTQLGDYLTAIHYTDYAIGTLISKLKEQGLWDNTVLVMYGDHFGLQPDKIDPEQFKTELGMTYDARLSRFNIPFIVHVPGGAKGGKGQVVEQVGGQLDMMPTIANLLGLKPEESGATLFGHDLLNIDRNVLGMRYYLPSGSFFNNDILFVPGKGFEDGTAVSLDTMEPVTNFEQYRSDYDYIMKLMGLSDKYVRMLPKRELEAY